MNSESKSSLESRQSNEGRLNTAASGASSTMSLSELPGKAQFSTSKVTKNKINSLLGQFTSFESEMKEGTRQRRERDEHELDKLRVEMTELEKAMTAETMRRVETAKALQAWNHEQVVKLRAELLQELRERMDMLDKRISEVHVRIDHLERDLAHEKETIPADIERRGAELTARLTAFQELFEEERKSRLAREKEINVRVAAHENQVAEDCSTERNVREQKYQEIKAILERDVEIRKERFERFHAFVEKEVAELKNSIARETVVREKEDDEIVETLTKYTEKLQASLRVINTTDV